MRRAFFFFSLKKELDSRSRKLAFLQEGAISFDDHFHSCLIVPGSPAIKTGISGKFLPGCRLRNELPALFERVRIPYGVERRYARRPLGRVNLLTVVMSLE